jgi:hypothetical protein
MEISRLTALVAAALLATACSSTETRTASSAPEPVAAAEEQVAASDEAAVEEEAPRYDRRSGCPNGYAPVGTRIKRCTSVGNDVRTTSADALRNVGTGTQQGATGRAAGGPPQS